MARSSDPVPLRYRDRSLETFDPSVSDKAAVALDWARRILAGQSRTLVLVGPPGVGKTHLAAGVVMALDGQRRARIAETEDSPDGVVLLPATRWCNVPELVTDLRGEMGTDENEAGRFQASLRAWRGLVVLDDLGREKVTDWTGELVYTLINARYEAMLPTIATSNLTREELSGNGYWPAVSRLAEDGAIVELTAPDRRIVISREKREARS